MQISRRDMLKTSALTVAGAMIPFTAQAAPQKKLITGFAAIDAQLPNGLPRGGVLSFIGVTGSGKTIMADTILAINGAENVEVVELGDLCLEKPKTVIDEFFDIHYKASKQNKLCVVTFPLLMNSSNKSGGQRRLHEILNFTTMKMADIAVLLTRTDRPDRSEVWMVKNRYGETAKTHLMVVGNTLYEFEERKVTGKSYESIQSYTLIRR